MQENVRLEHFPVSFFSMVMGLSGLTIAWEKTMHVMGIDMPVNYALALISSLVFVVLAGFYSTKFLRHRNAVISELHHPIKLNFFPAISISLILLSVATLHIYQPLSQVLWMVGSALHLALMLYVLNVWIHHEHFEIHHLNPAWFIPAVGNVLVPITGASLGYIQISWFFFSIGIIFWLILLTIIFNRVLFHQPLPGKLLPTLFILIAPPAVGFVSYVKLTGSVDAFAHVLFYIGVFFTLFLLTQIKRFTQLPFFLSWWAYSFPLAAITIASWIMFEKTNIVGMKLMALGLLTILTLVVLLLVFKTIQATHNGQICLPE